MEAVLCPSDQLCSLSEREPLTPQLGARAKSYTPFPQILAPWPQSCQLILLTRIFELIWVISPSSYIQGKLKKGLGCRT